jgi:predicted hydrocarbon binding protein
MLRLAKLVDMQDGEIKLMGDPIHIIPSDILGDMQKGMIEALGFEKAYSQIYESAKSGSHEYNKNFVKRYSMKDKRKVLDMQIKIVTSAGWGKLQVAFVDTSKKRVVIRYTNSPFVRRYGKQKYPVCIIPTGFTAGGVSVTLGEDIDAVETHCMALGHPYCEIELGPPKRIEKKRRELWAKWGIENHEH